MEVKLKCCFTSTETIGLLGTVGEGGDYIPIARLSPPE